MEKTKQALSIKMISSIAIFTAITAILAQVAIPLPFTPMPISFGVAAVYISGILQKPKHAAYSQICYLALGAAGIPVFSNFRGGMAALFGPTGGYLMAYPVIAWVASMALNSRKAGCARGNGVALLKLGVALCAAHVFLYLSGTAWYALTTGNAFYASLALTVFPFIPLDIAKILICVFGVAPIRARLLSAKCFVADGWR